MLRVALFTALLLAGVLLLEPIGLADEAWLVAGLTAAVLLFCIPQAGKARDPKDLIFNLVSVIAIYGIYLKFRPWLAGLIGRRIATVVSILFVLGFASVLLLLTAGRRSNTSTDNT